MSGSCCCMIPEIAEAVYVIAVKQHGLVALTESQQFMSNHGKRGNSTAVLYRPGPDFAQYIAHGSPHFACIRQARISAGISYIARKTTQSRRHCLALFRVQCHAAGQW